MVLKSLPCIALIKRETTAGMVGILDVVRVDGLDAVLGFRVFD